MTTPDNSKTALKNIIEDIEIRNLLSGDYWKFIYTATHIRKNHHKLIITNRKNLEILYSYIDNEYYTIRCIINASYCRICKMPVSYPLEKLNKEEMHAVAGLLTFSVNYGYYFWDIDTACNSSDILNFFIKNDAMPIPPLPFNSSEEQRARLITYRMVIGLIADARQAFTEEMKIKPSTFSISSQFGDVNFERKIKEIELQRKMTDLAIEQILDGEPRQRDDVAKLIKMRKCVVPDSFHADSNPARCIGLLMYDNIISPSEACDDIIGKFKTSELYQKIEIIKLFKKSNNPYISDKENSILKKWLNTTKECVEKMAVLSLK